MADPADLAAAEPRPEAVAAWRRHLGEDVEPEPFRRELAAGSLTQAFHATAGRAPHRPALAVEGATATHGELDALAARLGGWLRARRVQPGDRVVVAGPTSVELVAAYLGILRARAAMVPVAPNATADELAHVVEDSGAVAAFASPEAADHLRAGGLRSVVALEDLSRIADDGNPLPPESEPADVAMLAYTSGTTGRPKGVPLTHANVLASLRAAMRAWDWREDDVLAHALPLSHQHGLGGIQMCLLAGSRAVLAGRFDPERLARTLQEAPASVLFAVPAMYERLVGAGALSEATAAGLRLWVSGSAPLSPELAARVAGLLGEPPLERYGSTEAGLCISNLLGGTRKPGSVGFPLPGLDAVVVDEQCRPLDAGEDGEILLRGPQVFAGYWGNEAATAEAFAGRGWFRSGDVGRVDPEDGEFAITGRLKEMIVSGGLNVYPREVELVLESHPDVAQATVVGVPSSRWGEEVVGVVVAADGAQVDPGGLVRHARERLSAYKCPKRVIAVDELPVGETGKVRRSEVVELVGQAQGEEA